MKATRAAVDVELSLKTSCNCKARSPTNRAHKAPESRALSGLYVREREPTVSGSLPPRDPAHAASVPSPFAAYSQTKSSSSIRLGQVFGITVQIHWMWFLLPLTLVGQGPQALLLGTLGFVALFGIVFLHELGHCLAAKHFGIQVLDITFWPLGGMARMSELPEDPKIEGVIAAAGPLVNFALAAIALPIYLALGVSGLGAASFPFQWFIVVNLMLGVFNLVPAFPMDGGRILRAYLARTRDWVTATEMAVKTGRVAAIIMVLAVFLFVKGPSVCIMPLIAGFIWFAGARELWAVRLRHGYSPLGGMPNMSPFGAGQQSETWAETDGGPQPSGASFEGEIVAERQPGRGFTAEQLEQLEHYRGRLPRPRSEDDPL